MLTSLCENAQVHMWGYQPAAALRAALVFNTKKACWKQAAG